MVDARVLGDVLYVVVAVRVFCEDGFRSAVVVVASVTFVGIIVFTVVVVGGGDVVVVVIVVAFDVVGDSGGVGAKKVLIFINTHSISFPFNRMRYPDRMSTCKTMRFPTTWFSICKRCQFLPPPPEKTVLGFPSQRLSLVSLSHDSE